MELKDKVVVVTGAASGIGKAMAIRFAAEGARKVVCADMNLAGAEETANQIDGFAAQVNVAQEQDIADLIERVETEIGPIDLFCSNAGILCAGVEGEVRADRIEPFKQIRFYGLIFKDGFDDKVGIRDSRKVGGAGDARSDIADLICC